MFDEIPTRYSEIRDRLKQLVDYKGNVNIEVEKKIGNDHKTEKLLQMYGYLIVPTLDLVLSGDPDTMPTDVKKALQNIRQDVQTDLLKRSIGVTEKLKLLNER